MRSSWSFWSLTWSTWLYTANRPHWNSLPIKESWPPKHHFNGEKLTPEAILTFVYRKQPSHQDRPSVQHQKPQTLLRWSCTWSATVSHPYMFTTKVSITQSNSAEEKSTQEKHQQAQPCYWAAESTHKKARILSDTGVWNSAAASILTVFLRGNAPDSCKTNPISYLPCKKLKDILYEDLPNCFRLSSIQSVTINSHTTSTISSISNNKGMGSTLKWRKG